jgi:hypothetical protein
LGGNVKGKRLGLVLEIGFGLAPQPAVRAAIEAAAKVFERAGRDGRAGRTVPDAVAFSWCSAAAPAVNGEATALRSNPRRIAMSPRLSSFTVS